MGKGVVGGLFMSIRQGGATKPYFSSCDECFCYAKVEFVYKKYLIHSRTKSYNLSMRRKVYELKEHMLSLNARIK